MYALQAKDISKHYRRHQVLKGVDFVIEPGTLVGVVGENGSGKSTLLKVLAGELQANKGSVQVNGSIGYCPQQPVLDDALTVREHVDYFKAAYRMADSHYAEHLLEELHYRRFEHELAGNLSGGTKQKLNLTLALMHQPAVLLLDEPYQGFDWETYVRFWDVVAEEKRSGKAVVVISHLIFEQKKFDKILNLRNGKIYEA